MCALATDFVIDWISGVIPCDDVVSVMYSLADMFGDNEFAYEFGSFPGLRNYTTKFRHSSGLLLGYNAECDGINYKSFTLDETTLVRDYTFIGNERYSRFYCGDSEFSGTALIDSNNPYIYISCSGSVLKKLRERHSFSSFLNLLWSYGFCPSRFDVALDFFEPTSLFLDFQRSFRKPVFPGKCDSIYYRSSSPCDSRLVYTQIYNGNFYYNYQFGNHSRNMFRLYNKKVEQSLKNTFVSSSFWYRAEYELHSSSARLLWDKFIEHRSIPFLWVSAARKVYCPILCSSSDRKNCKEVSSFAALASASVNMVDFSLRSVDCCTLHQPRVVNHILNMASFTVDSLAFLLDKCNLNKSDMPFFIDIVREAVSNTKYSHLPLDFADSLCNFLADYADSHHIIGNPFRYSV